MKRIFILLIMIHCCFLFSFVPAGEHPVTAEGKSLNIMYVVNSRSVSGLNLTQDMVLLLSNKIDMLAGDPAGRFYFFLSNNVKPETAKDKKGAKAIVQKMADTYFEQPTSSIDKKLLRDILFTADLSNTKSINMHFFVSEYYLKSDLIGDNAGSLLRQFAKELEYKTGCGEENVNVFVYYPKNATSITPELKNNFLNLSANMKGVFESKIKIQFIPVQ